MAQSANNPPAMQETWVGSLGWKDPLEKGKPTHYVFWPGEFHGQRNLAGYSPWGRRVGNDWATFTFTPYTSPYDNIILIHTQLSIHVPSFKAATTTLCVYVCVNRYVFQSENNYSCILIYLWKTFLKTNKIIKSSWVINHSQICQATDFMTLVILKD